LAGKSLNLANEGVDDLFDALCNKVIPRLLRPLETGDNCIQPCLIHSDIWSGNCMPDADTGNLMLFDSCAFWVIMKQIYSPGVHLVTGLGDLILNNTKR
jgi:fructosamine-3-kinase